MSHTELSERHLRVLDYITRSPGGSKQEVVRAMKDNPSRITVLNILSELEQAGMINAKKEKPNSQIYKLFINNDNLIIGVNQDLQNLKSAFLYMLDKARKEFKKSNISTALDIERDIRYMRISRDMSVILNEKYHLIYAIVSLYRHLIGMYIIATLFIWPQKIKDKELTDKLYSLVFSRIQEIQSKISEIFPGVNSENAYYIFYYMLERSFELIPQELALVVEGFRNYGLEKECESILDPLWKISMDFIPNDIAINFFNVKDESSLKALKADWRNVYSYFVNRFANNGKNNRKNNRK